MKKLLIPISIISIFFLTSQSCKKHKTEEVYNAEFPNNVGTFWKYRVYDYSSNNLDTVTITVIGNTNLDNGDAVNIWENKSLFNPVTYNYVSNKSDGIRIYKNKLTSALPIKKYVFPLQVSNIWLTQNSLDTNRVIAKKDTTILGNLYNNCFKINRNTFIPYGQYIKETEFFLPDIGMIYRNYDEINSGPVESMVWELISYSIK